MRATNRIIRIATSTGVAFLTACTQGVPEAPGVTMPTAEEHTARYFPIGPSATHTTTHCSDCHTADTASFLQYDCIGCHLQPSVAGGVATLIAGATHSARICLASDKATTVSCFPPLGSGVATMTGRDQVAWSAKCLTCHPTGTADTLDRGVHSTAYFPIDAGTKHASTQCADCHSAEIFPRVTDYSKVDCVTCHSSTTAKTLDSTRTLASAWQAGATHAADPGLAYPGTLTTPDQKTAGSAQVCLFCHDHGSVDTLPPSAHTYFPITASDVHALGGANVATCADCHTDPSNLANVRCAGCHGHEQASMDPQHAHSSTYTFASTACLGCHPDGTAGAATGDLRFPIGAGTAHAYSSKAQTAAMKCDDCHGATRTSIAQLKCKSCHTSGATANLATAHSSVKDYLAAVETGAPAPTSCLQCHDMGDVHEVAAHPTWKNATQTTSDSITTSPHASATWGCLYCHPSLQSSPTWAADFTSTDCNTCHLKHSTVATLAQHSSAYFPIGAGTKHAAVQCADCHAAELSPGMTDYSKVDCVTCHSSTTATTLDGSRSLASAWQAGATHQTDPGLAYPGTLTTLDQKVAGSAQVCLFCHALGSVGTLSPSAHTYFPITASDVHALGGANVAACEDCHTDPTNRANVRCAGCHGHEQVNMDPQHAHSSAYTFVSTACLGCHPSGTAGAATGDLWFPIGAGTAHAYSSKAQTAAMKCDDCHGATRTDTTQLKCSACHSTGNVSVTLTTAHGTQAGDYASFLTPHPAGTPQCILCHDMAVVTLQATHSGFNINPTTGSRGTANRHSSGTIGCAGCHPGMDTAPTPWAADFSKIDCILCHRPGMGSLSTRNDAHSNCKAANGCVASTKSRCNANQGGYCFFDVYDDATATQAQILQASPACNGCHPNGGGT